MDFAILGAGRAAFSLAEALTKAGYCLKAVASRSALSAQQLAAPYGAIHGDDFGRLAASARLVFITTADAHIEGIAQSLARQKIWQPEHFVFHLSGSLPLSPLKGAKEAGAAIGSLHPLQTFAAKKAVSLKGVFFAVAGDERALPLAQKIVGDMGGKSFFVPEEKRALYHAGACFASNYLVSLYAMAGEIFAQLGLDEAAMKAALLPLSRAALDNIAQKELKDALTGPIERGDLETVGAHFKALAAAHLPTGLYRELGLAALKLAEKKENLPPEKLAAMRKKLEIDGEKK